MSRSWKRLNARYKATPGADKPPVQSIRTSPEAGEAVAGRLRPRPDAAAVDVPGARTGPSAPPPPASSGQGAEEAGGGGGSSRSNFSFDRPRAGAPQRSAGPAPPPPSDPLQPGYRHADGCVTPQWSLVHRGTVRAQPGRARGVACVWGGGGGVLSSDVETRS